jgi:hypothetical protein
MGGQAETLLCPAKANAVILSCGFSRNEESRRFSQLSF